MNFLAIKRQDFPVSSGDSDSSPLYFSIRKVNILFISFLPKRELFCYQMTGCRLDAEKSCFPLPRHPFRPDRKIQTFQQKERGEL